MKLFIKVQRKTKKNINFQWSENHLHPENIISINSDVCAKHIVKSHAQTSIKLRKTSASRFWRSPSNPYNAIIIFRPPARSLLYLVALCVLTFHRNPHSCLSQISDLGTRTLRSGSFFRDSDTIIPV